MRRFLPLAAAALLIGAGYLTYARARVSDAIRTAAEREQLDVAYETTGSWRPGSIGIRQLRVSAPQRAWYLELASLDLSLSPVLGGPRRVQISIPAQRGEFGWAELQVSGELAGHAELIGLQGSALQQLRAATLVASRALVRSATGVAHGIALDLQLASVAGASTVGGLRGQLALRGENAADLLRVSGAGAVVQWLFPHALQERFEATAAVRLDDRSLRLSSIQARCEDISLRGDLTWTGPAPDGALLLTRGARQIGLLIRGGEVQPELAPGADWLDRHRVAPKLADAELTSTAR